MPCFSLLKLYFMYILKHTLAYLQNIQTVNLNISNIFVPKHLTMHLTIPIPLGIQKLILNILEGFPYYYA